MQPPKTLDYLGIAPKEPAPINVPAVLSIASALGGMIFMFSVLAGIWKPIFPSLHAAAGWIVLGLSVCAVIWGGMGALRADRESRWYGASLLGYAGGMLVGTLSPMLFMM